MISALLASSLICATTGCHQAEQLSEAELALQAFLDDTRGPPRAHPSDALLKGKSIVIALPAISVTVWAVAASLVDRGGQQVFNNTIEDFETVLQAAFGWGADGSWAQGIDEPAQQAEHLTEALKRTAFCSEASDFTSVNRNDCLPILNVLLAPQRRRFRQARGSDRWQGSALGQGREGRLRRAPGSLHACPQPLGRSDRESATGPDAVQVVERALRSVGRHGTRDRAYRRDQRCDQREPAGDHPLRHVGERRP